MIRDKAKEKLNEREFVAYVKIEDIFCELTPKESANVFVFVKRIEGIAKSYSQPTVAAE